MKVGDCPSCGAAVEFAPGAGQVKVCEHCQTVVLRGEAKLENLGKAAELVDTDSPLKLGLSGKHSGVGFTIVGRLQKAHDTGGGPEYGAWDEWFLSFDDARSAWLSESEGAWNLMFPLVEASGPKFADANPGTSFQLKGTRFVIEERGKARTVAAQGQLPEFQPTHPFVDATGPKGVFVSIDYGDSDPGEAFVGSTVTLQSLGFAPTELAPSARRAAMSQARCTQCNGMLALQAPDFSRRVACSFCGALLDCSHGKLAFLELLKRPEVPPTIPLGAKGTLEGVEWTCLAFLVRSCEVELTRYPWEEYLLYRRDQGFRWLMNSNGHWTFLTPIPAGEVELSFKQVRHNGVAFTLYQSVNTTTDYVLGECYWAVRQGERGWAAEYIAPPRSINLDRTLNEVTFTLGTLLEPKVVEDAFKLKAMPARTGVASAQLNPWKERASEGWKWALLWSGAMIALFVVFALMSTSGTYVDARFTVPPGVGPASPEAMSFSDSFKIPQKTPLEVSVGTSGLSNQWLGVQTDLINQETFEVLSLNFELSDYHGVEDGESWSERELSSTKSTAEVDPGNYVVRMTPSFEGAANLPTDPISVQVKADPPGFCCPFFLVLLILCLPIYGSVRSSAFESSRWSDSVMQPADYTGTTQPAGPGRGASPEGDADDDGRDE